MLVVMEGDIFTIVGVNAGGGDNRSAEIAADVLHNAVSVAKIRFGVDVKALLVFPVNESFRFYKGRINMLFHFI